MRLLLVEDERPLAAALGRGLREEGHQVDLCENGADALAQARALPYDVILLDWGLPDLDGLSVLRAWRREGLQTPVIMLTARGAVAEKVAGFDAGADDYLPKPFAFEELLARLGALARRGGGGATGLRAQVGDLVLHVPRRSLARGDAEVTLTAREFDLAGALFARPGDVVTRSELLGRVWGPDFDGEPNVVDVYVGYLRKKIARLAPEGAVLETVRGLGWRLRAER
ncbi:MAG: response regulator transcription factor [Myxococcales bacterium]|nr:response regulator transcription factor [Myxococcales bacterium]